MVHLRPTVALLLGLLLTAGCSGPVTEGPDEATPAITPEPMPDDASTEPTAEPTPEASPAPDEPVTDEAVQEPTGEPVPVVTGEPYVIPANPRMPGMNDAFTFWGWSTNGVLYAFETYDPGEGAADCDMQYDVYVVDAETDKYADGGHVVVAHDSPEAGPGGCTPADLAPLIEAARTELFEKHGIVVGNANPPVEIKHGAGDKYRVAFASGEQTVAFRVLHGTDDIYSEAAAAGAAYYMAVKGSTSTWIIEPGRRRRPNVVGYRPELLFVSPDGIHAAFVVARSSTGFEGNHWSYMTNGLGLPDWLL